MKSVALAPIKRGTRVLLRADFNVPIKNNKVTDPFRIIKTLPTINFLKKKNAKIIVVTHAGDDGSQTLTPIAKVLAKHTRVTFIPALFGVSVETALANMKNGDVVLLENVRSEKGEKTNDEKFARALALYADIFVNDAFPVSHRAHASIVGVPKFLPAFAGLQLEKEVRELSQAFNPKHPFLFVLGGNKFSTKMPLIKKFTKLADHILIGGALANDLLKAKGYEVGVSLTEEGYDVTIVLKNKKLILPIDVVTEHGTKSRTVSVNSVSKNEIIVDVGPQTIKNLAPIIKKAKFVLFNGTLGKGSYLTASKMLLTMMAKSKAKTIIGGGDTVSVVSKFKMEKKFSFVSTGGGATLAFLAEGTLPGIKALK